ANVPPAAVDINWSEPSAQAFREAMDDDFNSAGAVAVLFDLAGQANRTGSAQVSGLMKALGGVLSLLQADPAVYLRSPTRYQKDAPAGDGLDDAQIDAMVQARSLAKQQKNFAEADRLRDALNAQGIELEDKPGGVTNWRRA